MLKKMHTHTVKNKFLGNSQQFLDCNGKAKQLQKQKQKNKTKTN